MRLAHPRRYEILDHLRTLDPVADRDEIVWLTGRHEFPWDYSQGTGVAFLRDYGIPGIAELLHRIGAVDRRHASQHRSYFGFCQGKLR